MAILPDGDQDANTRGSIWGGVLPRILYHLMLTNPELLGMPLIRINAG